MDRSDVKKMDELRDLLKNPDRSASSDMKRRANDLRMRALLSEEMSEVTPDTYGCDSIFVKYFYTPAMEDEFPLIVKDFLKHEMANIESYASFWYADPDMTASWPKRALQIRFMNLIVAAFRGGSAYAGDLLQYLYKTYYKKEYRQMKRFSRLSVDEVMSLSDTDEGFSFFHTARILMAAQFLGIELKPECNVLFQLMNQVHQEMEDESDEASEEVFIEKEEWDEAKTIVRDMFSDKEIRRSLEKRLRLAGKMLVYFGYPEDYLELCDEEMALPEDDYEKGLAFLKKTWPKKDFTKDQIADAAFLFHAIRAFLDTLDGIADDIGIVFGDGKEGYFEDFPPLFDPSKISEGSVRARTKDNGTKKEKAAPVKEDLKHDREEEKNEGLLKELGRLRIREHTLESENQDLRLKLKALQHQQNESDRLRGEYEADKRELAALREHVYQFTEADAVPEQRDLSEMRTQISKKKIIIIGGHSNWTNKLRNIYHNWKFVSPNVSGAVSPHVVENADYVYFFTDTIGHSTYYRYMQILREKKIPFGYIHGVNIDSNTAQIYRDLREKDQAHA